MRGWQATLIDGTVLLEENCLWKDVPKVKIETLTLHFDGRRWDLSNKEAYFVKNRGSVVPGFNNSFVVEERGIGFYEGSSKVLYTVNEFTGVFKIKVQ